jgi:hypothetical protein
MLFATQIGHGGGHDTLRYDEERQLSQILVGGVWLDAATARGPAGHDSRFTRVLQETTDDE